MTDKAQMPELKCCPFCGCGAIEFINQKGKSEGIRCGNITCKHFQVLDKETWNTRTPQAALQQEGEYEGPWEPKEIEGSSAIFVGDLRLCIDPSVPSEMILFPDDETRKWFVKRLQENDELDEAAHRKTMEILTLKKTIAAQPVPRTGVEDILDWFVRRVDQGAIRADRCFQDFNSKVEAARELIAAHGHIRTDEEQK